MDEQKLNKIAEKALEYIKSAEEFAIEQAPLVIQEFYHWCFWSHLFLLLIGATGLLVFYKSFKWGYDNYVDSDADFPMGVEIISGVFWLASLTMFIHNLYGLIKVWVAPRVYLITYISEMIK